MIKLHIGLSAFLSMSKKLNTIYRFVILVALMVSVNSYAQRVGIYTGTFDPPHIAHKAIVENILKSNLVDEIYVVPDDKTPYKPNKSPLVHRIAMLKIMFEGQSKVTFLDPSITDKMTNGDMWNVYNVVKENAKPQEALVIMGADTFVKYRDFSFHFDDHNFSLAVITRGNEIQIPDFLDNQKIHRIELDMADVSSTKIRNALRDGEYVTELPLKVFQYIKQHGLYNFPIK
ncbi:MAG: nicotinate-nicotinamide nucleotide adenylyltransferase [Bacteriovoracaceae bacterium]